MSRWVAVTFCFVAVSACSLVVSTNGLVGDALDAALDAAPDDAVSAGEGGPPPDAGETDATDATDALAPTDGAADAADALVGVWSFDEGTGLVAHDRSGHQFDGLLSFGAELDDAGVEGGAAHFPGAGVLDVAALNATAFPSSGTLSFWVRLEVDAGATVGVFDNYDTTRKHVFVRQLGGGKVQVALQPSNQVYAAAAELPTPIGKWTHVVVTWDLTVRNLFTYVDGLFYSSAGYAVDFDPSEQRFRFGGSGLTGSIDEVRLFDRALTPAEATALP